MQISTNTVPKVTFDPRDEQVADLRYQPFKPEDLTNDNNSIDIEKYFIREAGRVRVLAEAKAMIDIGYDLVEGHHEPKDYLRLLNISLAIFDKFGFDAPYDRKFVEDISNFTSLIILFGYTFDPIPNKSPTRSFNGKEYSRNEFIELFNKFLDRYEM